MKLVIAEKPDQMRKLADCFPIKKKDRSFIEVAACQAFPDGAIFTSCVGYLVELFEPDDYDKAYKKWSLNTLPIIPEKPKYKVSRDKSSQFQTIKGFIHDVRISEIINACDAGRAGEAIFRTVTLLSGAKKPIKRLWLSSMTKAAIEKAFAELKDGAETYPLFLEEQARALSDWLIGMNGSRAFTILLQKAGLGKDVYSVGRVQTALLRLLYDRQKAIESHVPKPFYQIYATFQMNGKKYKGKCFNEKTDRVDKLEDAQKVVAFCKDKPAEITKLEKEEQRVKPPPFFDLNGLQVAANKRFKFKPSRTLQIAQELYEKSYISYPRTDSTYVTEEEVKEFPKIFKGLERLDAYQSLLPVPRSDLSRDFRYCNASKVDDHYALIPTENIPRVERLSDDEKKIYDLIVRNFLAAHYEDAVYKTTEVITTVANRLTFITKARQLSVPGWKVVYGSDKDVEEEDSKDKEDTVGRLPDLELGETGVVASSEVKENMTKPLPRITAGGIIKVMQNAYDYLQDDLKKQFKKAELSIGTAATRGSIIDTLLGRNYIEIKKNEVFVTAKGETLIEAIGDHLVTSPVMTAQWEAYLHQIGKGAKQADVFIEQSKKVAGQLVEHAMKRAGEWQFDPERTAKVAESAASRGVASGAGKGGAPGSRKSTVGAEIGACPLCNEAVVDKGKLYGCSGYSKTKCGFTLPKKVFEKSLSATNAKKLLTGQETGVIKGCKSKAGKVFDASFIYNRETKKLDPIFGQRERSQATK